MGIGKDQRYGLVSGQSWARQAAPLRVLRSVSVAVFLVPGGTPGLPAASRKRVQTRLRSCVAPLVSAPFFQGEFVGGELLCVFGS